MKFALSSLTPSKIDTMREGHDNSYLSLSKYLVGVLQLIQYRFGFFRFPTAPPQYLL